MPQVGRLQEAHRYAQCANCHTPDPHSGQFARAPTGDAARAATPSRAGTRRPSRSRIMRGRDFRSCSRISKVKCAQCHKPAGPKTLFKMPYARCIDCHADEHQGQFAARALAEQVREVPRRATWKTIRLHPDQASEAAFPLTGAHMAVACNDCHKPHAGSPVALYHFKNLDVHHLPRRHSHGEFARCMAVLSPAKKPLGCETCHNTGGLARHGAVRSRDHGVRADWIASRRGLHRLPQATQPGDNAAARAVRQAPLTCSGCHRKSARRPVRRPG